jgi:geranylgeranyl diphosphate synthase type I
MRAEGGRLSERSEVPDAIAAVAPLIEKRLTALLDAELHRWSRIDPALEEPLSSLRSSVLSGGKRIRPAFCYWSFIGTGGDAGDSRAVDAGAALELLHTAALVHDDVIDGSARRHGAATVHVEQAARHRERRLRGDADRFGVGVAASPGPSGSTSTRPPSTRWSGLCISARRSPPLNGSRNLLRSSPISAFLSARPSNFATTF